MYAPHLGTFLQRDPLPQNPESLLLDSHDRITRLLRNLYSYVDDNPINHVDPSGFEQGWRHFVPPNPPPPPPSKKCGTLLVNRSEERRVGKECRL